MASPHIIFVVLDTLRADRLFIKHNKTYLTPFLKQISSNSIYFTNCIANSPWTLPSHISMFTGLYPTQTTLISNQVDRINEKIPLLAEILKNFGYKTLCYTENAFISKFYGLTRGFDEVSNVWDWNPWASQNYKLSFFTRLILKVDKIVNKNIKYHFLRKLWTHLKDRCINLIKILNKRFFFPQILFKLKNNTLKDLEVFYQIIEKNYDKEDSLFIFFNLLTTHDPYIPVKETFKLFNISQHDFKNIKNMIINPLQERLDINLKSKILSKNQIKTIEKLYNACIFSADLILKKIFTYFEKFGILENSYFIITSDHGEHLGSELDHNFWEHNTYQSVYKSLIRVPLLIYNKILKGKIIHEQVQLKDLFHTILDLTEIPRPKNKYLIKKYSIMSQIKEKSSPQYIFGEYLKSKQEMEELIKAYGNKMNRNLISKVCNHIYFLRSNRFKYIRYNNLNFNEFYDLLSDPNEKNNIFSEKIEECQKFMNKMDDFFSKMTNPQEIQNLLMKKEKDVLNSVISKIKTDGI